MTDKKKAVLKDYYDMKIAWEGDGLYGCKVGSKVSKPLWYHFKSVSEMESYVRSTGHMPLYIQEADLSGGLR